MHIAIFAHNCLPHPGGAEVIVDELAKGLAREHRTTLVSTAWGGKRGRAIEDGVVVWRLPAVHASERFGVPYPVPIGADMRAALAECATADIVHAFGALYATTLLAVHAARRAQCPLVLTDHVGFVEYPSGALNAVQAIAWRMLGDRVLGAADTVITYNDSVATFVASRPVRSTLTTIRNGVDLHRFRPADGPAERRRLRAEFGLPADRPLVLFIGRDAPKKRLDDALAIPAERHTLVVCGARRELVRDNVVDLGVVPHDRMPSLIRACDVLVHPATGEGFPLAVQEAMASGLAVVVRWEEGYGSTVPRPMVFGSTSPQELGRQVRHLVDDPAARDAAGAAARRWAESHWSWSTTVSEHARLYHRLIETRTTR